jgi:hypothetical protein
MEFAFFVFVLQFGTCAEVSELLSVPIFREHQHVSSGLEHRTGLSILGPRCSSGGSSGS